VIAVCMAVTFASRAVRSASVAGVPAAICAFKAAISAEMSVRPVVIAVCNAVRSSESFCAVASIVSISFSITDIRSARGWTARLINS